MSSSLTVIFGLALLLQQSPVSNVAGQEWMRADISCYAATSGGRIFLEQQLYPIGQMKKWASNLSCDGISQVNLTKDEYSQSTSIVPRAWLHLLLKEPIFVLHTHAMRNAYLLPLPISGLNRIPFLHSTIEMNHPEIKWRTPALANFMRYPIRFANLFSFILCWAGLWATIMLVCYLRIRMDEIKILLMLTFALMSVLFVAGPIADGRYVLYVTIIGISTSIRTFYSFIKGNLRHV